MMALRMLCEAPHPFAGIATIIASMPEAVGAACRSRSPLSVIMFNGTADPLIPYGGGELGFSGLQGRIWSVERTAVFLARRNGCTAGSKAVVSGRAAPGAIRVVKLDWTECSSERGVTLYRVEGGGHRSLATPTSCRIFSAPAPVAFRHRRSSWLRSQRRSCRRGFRWRPLLIRRRAVSRFSSLRSMHSGWSKNGACNEMTLSRAS
jgi:poly(3-hydroxybutyrate) depolymerase